MRAAGVLSVFIAVALLAASVAADNADRIESLPGLSHNLSFAMYAGYLTVNATHGRNLFYWFAESQNSPSTDPLLVWLQGGPGCSSMMGLFLENGPITVQTDMTIASNPWSWNRFANVLWIDAPVGTGFSYSKTDSDYDTDNLKTAEDNYAALQVFLQKYPAFAASKIYILGESYAGDYVPQLATQIVNGSDTTLRSNLAGFIIGNPVMSCDSWKDWGDTIQIELFYWHGMIPFSAYMEWKIAGCAMSNPPDSCDDLLNNITNMIGPFDSDNVYTDLLTGNATLGVGPVATISMQDTLTNYLNTPAVQSAIHAVPTNFTICCAETGQSGGQCRLNYTNNWTNMIPTYDSFFQNNPELRILIYSGDTDVATCPFAYTQLCLSELKRPLVAPWRPWTLSQQTAGYVEVHDRYTYATVKGAGHEVPMFQPAAAFTLVSSFVSGQAAPN